MNERAPTHNRNSNPERPFTDEIRIQLNIPGILGRLSEPDKTNFDDLMARVLPWRGNGFRLGINSLFGFVPTSLLDRIEQYLALPEGEERETAREQLVDELQLIRIQNAESINSRMERDLDDAKSSAL